MNSASEPQSSSPSQTSLPSASYLGDGKNLLCLLSLPIDSSRSQFTYLSNTLPENARNASRFSFVSMDSIVRQNGPVSSFSARNPGSTQKSRVSLGYRGLARNRVKSLGPVSFFSKTFFSSCGIADNSFLNLLTLSASIAV